jgi:hypothetical protein
MIESFDLWLSSEYILVRVTPSCFHFAKICLCQVSLLLKCSPRYDVIFLTKLNVVYVDRWTRVFVGCESDLG